MRKIVPGFYWVEIIDGGKPTVTICEICKQNEDQIDVWVPGMDFAVNLTDIRILSERLLSPIECKTCHGDQYLQPCKTCHGDQHLQPCKE